MTAFDRQQVIELARDELAGWPIGSGYYGTKVDVDEAREMAEAALPVIVAAVLKPIRELHAAGEPVCVETGHTPSLCPCSEVFCEGCGESMPCPTIRLLDEIEAAAKGGE